MLAWKLWTFTRDHLSNLPLEFLITLIMISINSLTRLHTHSVSFPNNSYEEFRLYCTWVDTKIYTDRRTLEFRVIAIAAGNLESAYLCICWDKLNSMTTYGRNSTGTHVFLALQTDQSFWQLESDQMPMISIVLGATLSIILLLLHNENI